MAKKNGRRRPLRDRVTQRAEEEAALRYAPQRRQLTAQQQAIADQFAAGAKAETATAKGIASSIDTVKPKVQSYIGTAQGISDQASQDLATYLGGAGSPLQGAAARDNAGTKRRLAEMLAGATTELDQRKVDAQAGAKYTIGSLRSAAARELEKVGGQLSDLASDEGVYASTVANKTREAQRQRAVTKRGQDLSHADRQASLEERRTARRQRDQEAQDRDNPNKFKPAPAGTKQRVASQIAYAKSIAQSQKEKKQARSQVAKWLVEGRQSQTVQASNGAKVKVPGINKTEELFASVGLDLAYDGHVSDRNRRLLNKLGISVKDLGLPSRGDTKQGLTTAIGKLRIPRLKG